MKCSVDAFQFARILTVWHLCMFSLIVICVTEVIFAICALCGGYGGYERWREDRVAICLLLSSCERLTQSENCCWVGFLR